MSASKRDAWRKHVAFENQERANFPFKSGSFYGMPEIMPTQTTGAKLSRFVDDYALDDEEAAGTIAHFYYDDYKFMAAWKNPDKYVPRLRRYRAVISPDFSLYTDFPRALQILSCYRRQWCGAYWQSLGIDIIPDVVWGDEQSYEYCFDGLPEGGTVAVSTVGVAMDKEWNGQEGSMFLDGYNEMMRRLSPTTVIVYGTAPEGLTGNIINVPSYYAQFRNLWKKG